MAHRTGPGGLRAGAWRLGHALLAVALLLNLGGAFRARAGGADGWARLPDDPLGARTASAAVGADGRIYVYAQKVRGFSSIGSKKISYLEATFHVYQPSSGAGSRLPLPAEPHGSIVASNGNIYAVQGQDSPGLGDPTEVFAPGIGRWHRVAPTLYSQGTGATTAAGLDGRIYILAGGSSEGSFSNFVEAYSPRADRWHSVARPPDALESPAAATGLDGRIYLLGGVIEYNSGELTLSHDVEAYDPRTRRWTMLAPMPTARAALAAVTGRDGRIYAVGGTIDVLNQATDESPPLRASGLVEAYDPQTNRWSAEPSLRVPRYALAAVAAPDGRIYAIGGSDTDAVEALTVPAPAKP